MCKHEEKPCPRCRQTFECKPGDVVHCQCYGIMLSTEESVARQLDYVMTEVYMELGLEFKTYVTTINWEGVKIFEE